MRVLLAAEHRRAAIGPGEGLGAVVGGIHHDGVVLDAELLELVEQLPDHCVMLDHAVGIDAEAGLAFGLRLQMREDVHPGGVPPHEERLAVFVRLIHEVERRLGGFLVDRLHALLGQRAGVFDLLLAVGMAQEWITPRGPNFFFELRVLRIVGVLGLLLRVEVVEVAEELVEAVIRRQHLVAVAQVVLAELARGSSPAA